MTTLLLWICCVLLLSLVMFANWFIRRCLIRRSDAYVMCSPSGPRDLRPILARSWVRSELQSRQVLWVALCTDWSKDRRLSRVSMYHLPTVSLQLYCFMCRCWAQHWIAGCCRSFKFRCVKYFFFTLLQFINYIVYCWGINTISTYIALHWLPSISVSYNFVVCV